MSDETTAAVVDLPTWLLEQIAADEAVARRAVENKAYFEVKGWAWWDNDFGDYHLFEDQGSVGMPARVLAECEAKRRLVAEHPRHPRLDECYRCVDWDGEYMEATGQPEGLTYPCPSLRFMALPYADRPGYDESWRP